MWQAFNTDGTAKESVPQVVVVDGAGPGLVCATDQTGISRFVSSGPGACLTPTDGPPGTAALPLDPR